jgi:hypothetical protein
MPRCSRASVAEGCIPSRDNRRVSGALSSQLSCYALVEVMPGWTIMPIWWQSRTILEWYSQDSRRVVLAV